MYVCPILLTIYTYIYILLLYPASIRGPLQTATTLLLLYTLLVLLLILLLSYSFIPLLNDCYHYKKQKHKHTPYDTMIIITIRLLR